MTIINIMPEISDKLQEIYKDHYLGNDFPDDSDFCNSIIMSKSNCPHETVDNILNQPSQLSQRNTCKTECKKYKIKELLIELINDSLKSRNYKEISKLGLLAANLGECSGDCCKTPCNKQETPQIKSPTPASVNTILREANMLKAAPVLEEVPEVPKWYDELVKRLDRYGLLKPKRTKTKTKSKKRKPKKSK